MFSGMMLLGLFFFLCLKGGYTLYLNERKYHCHPLFLHFHSRLPEVCLICWGGGEGQYCNAVSTVQQYKTREMGVKGMRSAPVSWQVQS